MADPKKVLIADDEADVRAFVEAVLEVDGYQFVTAADGEAALKAARAEAPDLVVLDVQMPKKDGFQVFSELRRGGETRSIPVIMLTGVGERLGIGFGSREMGEYLGSEPEGYIEKPIDPDLLRSTVSKVLGGASA